MAIIKIPAKPEVKLLTQKKFVPIIKIPATDSSHLTPLFSYRPFQFYSSPIFTFVLQILVPLAVSFEFFFIPKILIFP